MTRPFTSKKYHVLNRNGNFSLRTNLCRNLEVSSTYSAALNLNLRCDILKSFFPNLQRSLVRIFHLLADQIDGVIKNSKCDTLLPLQHKIVHKACYQHVVELGIRK